RRRDEIRQLAGRQQVGAGDVPQGVGAARGDVTAGHDTIPHMTTPAADPLWWADPALKPRIQADPAGVLREYGVNVSASAPTRPGGRGSSGCWRAPRGWGG